MILGPNQNIFKYTGTGLAVGGPTPWVDVRAYGAVGNGVADDTAAMQRAIDSLPQKGGRVYIPSGTYKITSTLKIIHANSLDDSSGLGIGIQICGDGPEATLIQANLSSTDLLASKDKSKAYNFVKLADFSIDNTSRDNSGSIGINLTNLSRVLVENVWVYNVNVGIYSQDRSWWNTIMHCTIGWDFASHARGVRTGVSLSSATNPANEWHIISCNIRDSDTGILLNAVTNTNIIACAIENFATTGINNGPTTATANTKVIGNRLENQSAVGTCFQENSSNTSPFYVGNLTPTGSFATMFGGSVPNTGMIWHEGRSRSGVATTSTTGADISISVLNADTVVGSAGSATSIADFTNSLTQQRILFLPTTANYTLRNNANIQTKTGADRAVSANTPTILHRHSGKWYEIG